MESMYRGFEASEPLFHIYHSCKVKIFHSTHRWVPQSWRSACVFLHEWNDLISPRGQGSLHFLLKTMTHDWLSDGKYVAWWHHKQCRSDLYHTPSIFHLNAAPWIKLFVTTATVTNRVIYPFTADRQTVVQQHHSSGNDILKHWQESYKISMLFII